MVVHQQYEWITEREVLWRDDWRCQVPWPYEPGGQFRNVMNPADTALVQHPYLLSRTLNAVFPYMIRAEPRPQHPDCLLRCGVRLSICRSRSLLRMRHLAHS